MRCQIVKTINSLNRQETFPEFQQPQKSQPLSLQQIYQNNGDEANMSVCTFNQYNVNVTNISNYNNHNPFPNYAESDINNLMSYDDSWIYGGYGRGWNLL